MSAYVKSTDVNLASNSKFIQVNDGANIGNIRDGWPVAINGIVIGFAKVVNTSATPPTIELYEPYTGSAITGGVLLTFPSQGQLTVIGDRITALTNTYEALADSVSTTPTANSVVKRDANGRVKTANAVNANEAVALGQLGTAATADVTTSRTDRNLSRLMKVGDFGLGGQVGIPSGGSDLNDYIHPGFYGQESSSGAAGGANYPINAAGGLTVLPAGAYAANSSCQLYTQFNSNRVFYRSALNGVFKDWVELHHTGNTTVDTNGFIKQASPIIRLYADRIESNEQVDSAIFTKNAVGDYTISGTEGFAQEGWYIETPKDRDGFPKVLVDYQQDEDGTIHVQCYEFNFNRELTTKVDIPDGRWIDIRLHKTITEPAEEDEA